MNSVPEKTQPVLREHVLFYTYRWFAWLVAAVVLLVPGAPELSALLIGLLVVTGVLNILATALARPYVQLVQQRPWLLGLDMLIGLSLVWMSGGHALPFLPYALGSLLLPALLLQQRNVFATSLLFVLLDQATLRFMQASLPPSSLIVRIALPLVVVLACLLLFHMARQMAQPLHSAALRGDSYPPTASGFSGAQASFVPTERRSLSMLDTREQRRMEPLIPPGSTTTFNKERILAEPRTTHQRHDVDTRHSHRPKLTPAPAASLETTLNQLVTDFGRDSSIRLELSLHAEKYVLSPGKQMALLRLAQEALLNVQQHARAHSAHMSLTAVDDRMMLTVEDDGVGLLDGTHERPGIHALRLVHYRLVEFDGCLEVLENDSGGLLVRGILPIHN